MNNDIDLGVFISQIPVATQEEKYDWRLTPVMGDYTTNFAQLALLATLGNRSDYSVVEVVTRQMYKNKGITYPADTIALAVSGDNKYGNEIHRDIGLSMAIIHVVEIASITMYRERNLTPIHYMLLDSAKVKINFPSPWEAGWPKKITWAKTAYNYGDLISDRQNNITEDQQRRIEGLVIAMISNRPSAQFWLSETKHDAFEKLTGWEALRKHGFEKIEKHLCWIDRSDCDYDSGC